MPLPPTPRATIVGMTEHRCEHPVAIITGAGGGLGRTFAQALADAGWRIAAFGRTASTLEETIASLRAGGVEQEEEDGARHLAVPCDITDAQSVAGAFEQITEHFGRLDLLVNNAGIPGPTGELDGIALEEFQATITTNLTGTFLCTQHAFAWMRTHGGGRIINNGSIAAHSPRAGAAAYAASKAAVASLTVSTSLDGRPYGITCTELDIGNARTALLGTFTGSEPMFDATQAARMLVAVASLPADVCVDQLTVTAAGMPYLGRG